jgi:hypothetical protein
MLRFGITLNAPTVLAVSLPAKTKMKQRIAGMYAVTHGHGRSVMSKQASDEIGKGVPHCRIRADVTSSNAWRVLNYSSKALYLDLRAKLRIGTNGNVSAAMSDLKHKGWSSSATLAKALYELLAVGLIVKTRSGGVERGSNVCSLYAFTDLHINPNPKLSIEKRLPLFEYRNFKTVSEACLTLESGVAKLRAEALDRKGNTKATKKKHASEIEAVKPSIASETEAVERLSASKTEAVKKVRNAA